MSGKTMLTQAEIEAVRKACARADGLDDSKIIAALEAGRTALRRAADEHHRSNPHIEMDASGHYVVVPSREEAERRKAMQAGNNGDEA